MKPKALVWLLLRTARGNPKIPGATPWLRVLASSDGYVSLSQAQIMLWSLLVFAGGIYVLTLSGTLIGLTSGTLTLLGIQGATTLLARTDGLPGVSAAPAGGTKLKHDPAWSDLVTVDGDPPQIDVTRVQAVIATVLAAVYVAMSMFHNYEIPEIPQNFLILMGISNGIYLTGRLLPNTSRNR